ncbi:MAG: HGGxSTG domain-containing protein [Aminipila sp.]
MSRKIKIQLPEDYDPADPILKAAINKNADTKNLIDKERKNPTLICGAVRNGKPCRQIAGAGTDHAGYGRCKYHGGLSTGPKTEQGKLVASQNARTHGLYSKSLLPDEVDIWEALKDEPIYDLQAEIQIWTVKIIEYLRRIADKYKKDLQLLGVEGAYRNTRIYSTTKSGKTFYHAGTIEDPILDRALNTLRQMILTQNKITGKDDSSDNILDAINSELRAASQGAISLSWCNTSQSVQPSDPLHK